jgi:hypothetical protein
VDSLRREPGEDTRQERLIHVHLHA